MTPSRATAVWLVGAVVLVAAFLAWAVWLVARAVGA